MKIPGDMVAIVILIAAFAVVLGFKSVRENKTITLAFWFVIFLHTLVAVINRYAFTVIGADTDAKTFQSNAEVLAVTRDWQFAIGSLLYEQMLGYIYSIFGTSHLLGESLSVFVFAISCIVLLKIMDQFKIADNHKTIALITYGAFPSMLCLGSVTLREPYQILFFMLAVFFALKFHNNGKTRSLLAAIAACTVMAVLHKGLFVYAIFFSIVITIWPRSVSCKRNNIAPPYKTSMLFVITPISLIIAIIYFSNNIFGTAPLKAIIEGNVLEFIQQYRNISPIGRTNYGLFFDYSSFANIISSSFKLNIYYLFSPFPWQITHPLDIYAMLEAIFRFLLILFSILAALLAPKETKSLYRMMLFFYFSMTFLWALGTVNYGTAIRHHLVSNWIIISLGIAPFLSFTSPIIEWSRNKAESLVYNGNRILKYPP